MHQSPGNRQQLNRIAKDLSRATADYAELEYIVHRAEGPRALKRQRNRANRRLNQLIIQEELNA